MCLRKNLSVLWPKPLKVIIIFPDDAVARKLITVYNFRSQRSHLNYLFLSNVYSFDAIEFSMKHKY